MSSRDEIAGRIIKLVAETSPNSLPAITTDSRLVDDLGFDSVSLIELAVAIEQSLQIGPITVLQTRSITTVGELAAAIEQQNK